MLHTPCCAWPHSPAKIIFLANPATSPSAFWKAVEAISVVRLVRLGHVLPSAQEFLLVTSKSASVVFPLLIILAALTYLWSVCGVVFFGNDTYLTGDLFGDGNAWEGVNRHQGFYGVAQGMQTMIGVATTPGSNGWVTLMQRYEDVTSPKWRWAVLLFFGSYALLTRFLLVQFFMITLLFKYKTHSHDKVGRDSDEGEEEPLYTAADETRKGRRNRICLPACSSAYPTLCLCSSEQSFAKSHNCVRVGFSVGTALLTEEQMS